MAVLPTNYLDDILAASMGGKRRFRITHEDGNTEEVTLEDVSEYEQVGSPFGSGDVNKTNQAVNEKLDSADVVDPALATVLGFAADAKLTGDALGELTKKLQIKITEVSGTTDSRGRINTDFDITNKIIVGLLSHNHGEFCFQYRMSANTLGVDFLNSADFSPVVNSIRSANVYYIDMPS